MSLDCNRLVETFKLNQPNIPLSNLSTAGRDVIPSLADNRWSPVLIWQLTTAEMEQWGVKGQVACFNVLLNEFGSPLWRGDPRQDNKGLSFRYGWGNEVRFGIFEKVWPEPHGNFTMGMGGEFWVEIYGPRVASDRVYGITLPNKEDDRDPNGHHATVIAWQKKSITAAPITPPVQPPAVVYLTVSNRKLDDALTRLDALSAECVSLRKEIASWKH